MPAIPSIASFTGASVTEGEFKTALSNLHLFLTGLLGTDGTQAGGQAALGALLGAGSETKTASYTVTSADRGKVIACSGTFAVTLPDASAVGSGFAIAVANYDTGTITVDPFSTQTIDGATTKTLAANTMLVACAVSDEWLTVGGVTLPTASTSTAGIVQLVDSYGSTSQSQAPTANALKAGVDVAYAHANAAYNRAYASVYYDQGHNIVGSLCFAFKNTTPATAPGGTVAGSSLMPAGLTASAINNSTAYASINAVGTLSGTWRSLGYGGFATLWQRIS